MNFTKGGVFLMAEKVNKTYRYSYEEKMDILKKKKLVVSLKMEDAYL